jgi:glucose-1-phosphate adenylyltransferase
LTKSTLALILAGGRGSRLDELTNWRAKPSLPFGGKFRIIDFTLSNCVNSGIRRIGICTQYKAQSLIRHIQRGWSFLDGRFDEFVELLPAQQRVEPTWYRGTADAVSEPRHSAAPCAGLCWCSRATMSTRWTTASCSTSTSRAAPR